MKPYNLYIKYATEHEPNYGASVQAGALGGGALGAVIGMKHRFGPVRAGLVGALAGAAVPAVANADVPLGHIRDHFA